MKKGRLILILALNVLLFSQLSGCRGSGGQGAASGIAGDGETASAATEAKSGKELTVVCLGDSVTAGVFELKRTGSYFFGGYVYDPGAAYPALLETKLRDDYRYDAEVYNAGVSGDTVDMGISRLEEDVFSRDPDIVTVCFGLNDVCLGDAELFKTQLTELFGALRTWKLDVKIVFITPNMLATYVHEDAKDDYVNRAMAEGNVEITESGLLDIYMDAAREVCGDNNVPVCDVYAWWKNLYENGGDVTELLASHVTHPSREMHAVFADMLVETLKEYNMIEAGK